MGKTKHGVRIKGSSNLTIRISHSGNYSKTREALENMRSTNLINKLNKYGQMGVDALAAATPVDSGVTADSWGYRVVANSGSVGIEWTNSNVNKGISIVILLQYGHATGTGGYVEGRDFINPAMQPVFDEIAEKVWKEVTAK